MLYNLSFSSASIYSSFSNDMKLSLALLIKLNK